MEHNANPKIASQAGATPLDIATEWKQAEIIAALNGKKNKKRKR
jgi:hypothetical protein